MAIQRIKPRIRTGQYQVQTISQAVRGENPNRISLVLTNAGAATVYLGTSPNVTVNTGYPLLANTSIVFTTKDPIYAIVAASVSILGWIEE